MKAEIQVTMISVWKTKKLVDTSFLKLRLDIVKAQQEIGLVLGEVLYLMCSHWSLLGVNINKIVKIYF